MNPIVIDALIIFKRQEYYDRLYSDMPTIIKDLINQQLNNVEFVDELNIFEHRVVFNPYQSMLCFRVLRNIPIDEKDHHRMLLLNSDYIQNIVESPNKYGWTIYRNSDYNECAFILQTKEHYES